MSRSIMQLQVLQTNTVLTHLNLGRNRVTGNGCTVLAAALAANTSLLLLELDGGDSSRVEYSQKV